MIRQAKGRGLMEFYRKKKKKTREKGERAATGHEGNRGERKLVRT